MEEEVLGCQVSTIPRFINHSTPIDGAAIREQRR